MKKIKEKSTGFFKDFKAFITRGNVIDMAIGVVVANAFKDIVNKFTSSFINPLVSYMTDGVQLSDLKYVIREEVLDDAGTVISKEVAFTWGIFLQSVIDFFIIALVLFIVLRVAAHISKRAKELRVTDEERAAAEAAAAEAKAKEEAAEKAAAEAKAAADAEIAAAKQREIETVELLREIRNSLSKQSS